jgi:hypothetical protein
MTTYCTTIISVIRREQLMCRELGLPYSEGYAKINIELIKYLLLEL